MNTKSNNTSAKTVTLINSAIEALNEVKVENYSFNEYIDEILSKYEKLSSKLMEDGKKDIIYFAYKNGEVKQFSTREEATAFSKNIESNGKEINREINYACNAIYNHAEDLIKQCYMKHSFCIGNITELDETKKEKIFNIIYNHSYEENHSYGLKEVFNGIENYENMISSIIKIVMEK